LHNGIYLSICPRMDGCDLLFTTACGSGKLGYLILLMLFVHKIAADKTLVIGEVFHFDLVMIVLCPTKALEENIVSPIMINNRMPLS
jgi:hypothetical protein